jgi:hypothetical protein
MISSAFAGRMFSLRSKNHAKEEVWENEDIDPRILNVGTGCI